MAEELVLMVPGHDASPRKEGYLIVTPVRNQADR